jgi:hypothetical protein
VQPISSLGGASKAVQQPRAAGNQSEAMIGLTQVSRASEAALEKSNFSFWHRANLDLYAEEVSPDFAVDDDGVRVFHLARHHQSIGNR